MPKIFNPKPEVIVLCGIPGIGKSYFVQNFFQYHHRVNLDLIHSSLSEGYFEKRNIALARDIESLIIEDRLNHRIPVIIDNTNITREQRSKYINAADNCGVDVKAIYFNPDVNIAISQNEKRDRKVPKVAIYKMARDFQVPETSEGFLEVYSATNPCFFGKRKAIFFDRDGVILNNKVNGRDHFVNKIEDIVFYENSLEALKKFSQKGYELFIVSNQAGVSMRFMTEQQLKDINDYLKDTFIKNKINLKEIYCCTHSKNSNCKCRKPKTGMIIQAAYNNCIDLGSSFFVGDMTADIEVGKRVGLKTILLGTGFNGADKEYNVLPDFNAEDIYQASEIPPEAAYSLKLSL